MGPGAESSLRQSSARARSQDRPALRGRTHGPEPFGTTNGSRRRLAKIGTNGANGSARIEGYANGSGSVILKLAKFRPSTSLPIVLAKGTCSSVGSTILKLPAIRTSSKGAAARTSVLSATQVGSITAAASAGTMIIRVGSATTGGVRCGPFVALNVPPTITATIGVGVYPVGVAVTPLGVLVANSAEGTISRVDPATNSVLANIVLTMTGDQAPVAITSGEGGIWVTMASFSSTGDLAPGSVERLDPVTGQVVTTIPVGTQSMSITTGAGAVWVPSKKEGTVTRIDPATNTVAATIQLEAGLWGIGFGFGSVWVSNDTTGTVSRIDPATNTVTASIATVGTPGGIVTGAGSVWVGNWGHNGAKDGVVSRIDPATNQVVKTIPVGGAADSLAFGGGFVWAALGDAPTVVQVNPATSAVLATVTTGPLMVDSDGDPVGIFGIAATDHDVWAAPRQPSLLPGKLYRIHF